MDPKHVIPSAEAKDSPQTQNSRGETLASATQSISAAPEGPTSGNGMITIDDFAKCKIKVGLITAAERVPETEKLIKLSIDCGEGRLRTIVSGIAAYYPDPATLVGKRVPVLANLAPRKMKGIESEGMVLYAVGADRLSAIEPNMPMEPGTPVQ